MDLSDQGSDDTFVSPTAYGLPPARRTPATPDAETRRNTPDPADVYFSVDPRTVLLPVHIVAGGLAIVLGGTALLAPKGRWLHRRSGLLFVFAMVTMGMSGAVLALRQSLTNANVIGGFMSAYFVVTALTTVRPVTVWTRRLNVAALIVALGLVAADITMGVVALGRPGKALHGVPFFMAFFLATITALAAAGDVRVIWQGALRGSPRLARHLWRMCFALFIAAGSFFSIRARVARVLPEPFTTPGARALPIMLVFVAMFYWLWRVRSRRAKVHLAVATARSASPPADWSPP